MFGAYKAGTTKEVGDIWRVVRYLLENAKAGYKFTDRDGNNLASIIGNINKEAVAN